MKPDEREQIIALLVIWTGYAESAFENMTDKELLQEFDRRVGE
jgi:hypothetical protein